MLATQANHMLNVLAEAAELDSGCSDSREESPTTSASGDDANSASHSGKENINTTPKNTTSNPMSTTAQYQLNKKFQFPPRSSSSLDNSTQPASDSNLASILKSNSKAENVPRQSIVHSSNPSSTTGLEQQQHSRAAKSTSSLYYSYHEQSKTMSDDPLVSLLGPNASGVWTHSEDSLITALQLRAEQEKTKQEFYRLEYSKKILEILKEAISYKVPPDKLNDFIKHMGPAHELLSQPSPASSSASKQQQSADHQHKPSASMTSTPIRNPLSTAALAAAAAVNVGSVGGEPSTTTHKRHQSQPVVQHPIPISPSTTQYHLDTEPEPITAASKSRHAKHSSINSSFGSPTRTAYSSKAAWACPPQPITHFPPPQPSTSSSSTTANPSTSSSATPSSGTSQQQQQPSIGSSPNIQFHHWQPSKVESSSEEQVIIKRRRSVSDRPSSPTPPQRQFASPKMSTSHSHSSHLNHILQQKSSPAAQIYSHAKQRSETFISKLPFRPWVATSTPPARYPDLAQPSPSSPIRSPVLLSPERQNAKTNIADTTPKPLSSQHQQSSILLPPPRQPTSANKPDVKFLVSSQE